MELLKMSKFYFLLSIILMFTLVACAVDSTSDSAADDKEMDTDELIPVSFVLDWTPNTNHTGIFVAKENGYFEDEGLDVDIMLPGKAGADQLIASGKAEFGISTQKETTQARSEGLPIVSVAAVIQHHTAGYAFLAEENVTGPKDFEGKAYGGYGSETEKASLKPIMDHNDADFDKIEFLNIGDSDFFAAVERDIDFASIFYAWTGIEAEIRGIDLDVFYTKDFADELDSYSPIISANEDFLEEDTETAKRFMAAAVKGYEFAIDNPEEAADILIKAVPDLDPELVKKSQEWLSPRYQEDADQWGIQEKKRWVDLTNWMVENDILDEEIDNDQVFTNEFLPERN